MCSQFFDLMETQMFQAVGEVLKVILDEEPVTADDEESDDFYPGQRFYLECFTPLPLVFFLEMSLSLKKEIIKTIFHRSWGETSHSLRDDCLLDIADMIFQRFLWIHLKDPSNVRLRLSQPLVIFDEYEDDLEVSTLDLFQFDYRVKDHPFSIILGKAPRGPVETVP